jgi:pimeloyl-ACP methyl ester carboxylesterase
MACAAAAVMLGRAGGLMQRTSCGVRSRSLLNSAADRGVQRCTATQSHTRVIDATLSTQATKDVAKLNFIDFNPEQSIEQSTPVVIMHGLLGNSRNFQTWGANLVKMLVKQRRCFAVDMRNHGASSHHASMTYPEMAEDIVAFMQERGLPKAVLLGHSMGGKVTVRI